MATSPHTYLFINSFQYQSEFCNCKPVVHNMYHINSHCLFFRYSWGGMKLSTLVLLPQICLFHQPQMIYRRMIHWWTDNWQVKGELSGEILLQSHEVHFEEQMDRPSWNPGLRGKKRAASSLSCGTVFSLLTSATPDSRSQCVLMGLKERKLQQEEPQ
jgi:hypothetical protein